MKSLYYYMYRGLVLERLEALRHSRSNFGPLSECRSVDLVDLEPERERMVKSRLAASATQNPPRANSMLPIRVRGPDSVTGFAISMLVTSLPPAPLRSTGCST